MTNDILKMAQDAGFSELDGIVMGGKSDLEAFAKLVADKARQDLREEIIYTWVPPRFVDFAIETEREACAVIAEEWFCGCGRGNCPEGDLRAHDIAHSIRARGQDE